MHEISSRRSAAAQPTAVNDSPESDEALALYRRVAARLLPRLEPELTHASLSKAALLRQADCLCAALEAERQRGLAGHWTFDANRLIGLRQAVELALALSARHRR